MSTALDKLITRAASVMTTPDKDMRKAIATAHSAATYAAIKERTGVMPKGLSRAERNDLKARVAEQLKYYDKFASQAGDMSDAAVAARAGMYAGAVRGTYYGQRYPGLSQYPGDGNTKCLTNCLCSLDERDDGIHWVLDGGEHCDDCEDMASGSPYNSETKAIKAQTDQERAMFAKMGGGKGPGKGYDKSKSTLQGDKAEGGGSGGAAAADRPAPGTAAPLNAPNTEPTALPVRQFDNPRDADKYLKSQTDVKLTDAEQESLEWYQGSGYDAVNGHLRGNSTYDYGAEEKKVINEHMNAIDSIFDKSKTTENIEVHRGMFVSSSNPGTQKLLDTWQPGATLRDPGYISTTVDPKISRSFSGSGSSYAADPGDRRVDVRMRVPAGTPAVYMNGVLPDKNNSEKELMLGRGLSYRVVGRTDSPSGNTTVDLEIVP